VCRNKYTNDSLTVTVSQMASAIVLNFKSRFSVIGFNGLVADGSAVAGTVAGATVAEVVGVDIRLCFAFTLC